MTEVREVTATEALLSVKSFPVPATPTDCVPFIAVSLRVKDEPTGRFGLLLVVTLAVKVRDSFAGFSARAGAPHNREEEKRGTPTVLSWCAGQT